MTWGTGTWGTGIWGGTAGAQSGISMVSALPTSTHTVEVTLSGAAKAHSPAAEGDALNPTTWTVTRLDTSDTFTVLDVQSISGGDDVFELYVLEAFGGSAVTHRVESADLESSSGLTIGSPDQADFLGVGAPLSEDPAEAGVDLQNDPFSLDGFPGSLSVGADGDYANETRESLFRKVAIRRLTTLPGGFFHLDEYGAGLKVKEPIPLARLPELRGRIEAELGKEPGFAQIKVQLSLLADNTLSIKVSVRVTESEEGAVIQLEAQNG